MKYEFPSPSTRPPFPCVVVEFQENLLKTMMQIEDTFFSMAEHSKRNCLIICDRGTMDASACE